GPRQKQDATRVSGWRLQRQLPETSGGGKAGCMQNIHDASSVAMLARHHELRPGEQITGTVQRLPQHGAFRGNSLLLRLDDGELVALEATAKRGFTTLERELERQAVLPGRRIRITFVGWREARTSQ